ncbi:MAG TPA: ATP-binding cassette domain-containing protein [Myxococcales bacterium]|nr:ATP-binding cassette domain-containing protein [Acidobacteriota bacterium]HZX96552.1 ATP-binding cassette domain-containing protein [Myxococcales bacterium]
MGEDMVRSGAAFEVGTAAGPGLVLEAAGVEKHYWNGGAPVAALRGISLDLAPGDFVAILGGRGAGKSTLLNIAGCIDRPTGGTCRIAGEDIGDLGPEELAEVRDRHIGFVFHGLNLIPGTSAVENVELPMLHQGIGLEERRRRAADALARVDLGASMHCPVEKLSRGERARLAIARALVNHPTLLLVDEPISGSRRRNASPKLEVAVCLRRLNREGLTILLATGDGQVAAQAKRIVRLAEGRILSGQCVLPARQDRRARVTA